MSSLSERASRVLYAVVSEFIATGEPVGSRTLSNRYGLDLSPATIRNVLSDLEEDGYLTQPHTSAGRVPTDRAFRLFIDALMRLRQLPVEDASRIRDLFSQSSTGTERLREAGKLLSDLSGVPAVVLQTRSSARSVQKIRFIPVGPSELLSVVVLDDGSVENRFIPVEALPAPAELERVHNLLDEATSGRSLSELRQHLREVARRERAEVGHVGRLGDELLGSALRGVEHSREIIVEGRTSLLHAGEGPERLERLMAALEDRERLVSLLDRTLDTTQVQVFLGSENEQASGSPLSVVAAAYRHEDRTAAGALGVLGPTRMDYPGLVPLVGTMAQAMSRALGYSGGDGADPRPGEPAIDPGSEGG
ncbi:MAG TPA: heat-inducible transcriptional repressor HrcA [Polyangiaceae bacterium]|nr:heat-inducible transcriptional repressor HrcA [Polyangiaceae bacterium]